MDPIQLIKNKNEVNTQLDFLIHLEFRPIFQRYRTNGIYLVALTILIVLISIFSDDGNYLALKGVSIVMLALTWLFALGYLIAQLIKYQNRRKWKSGEIKRYMNYEPVELYFDDELISYKTNKYNSSLNWGYFTYFTTHKNSIFIFHSSSYIL